jgi:hypothetical protein
VKNLIRRYSVPLYCGILALILLWGTFRAINNPNNYSSRKPQQLLIGESLQEKDGFVYTVIENDLYSPDGKEIIIEAGSRLKGVFHQGTDMKQAYIEWKEIKPIWRR